MRPCSLAPSASLGHHCSALAYRVAASGAGLLRLAPARVPPRSRVGLVRLAATAPAHIGAATAMAGGTAQLPAFTSVPNARDLASACPTIVPGRVGLTQRFHLLQHPRPHNTPCSAHHKPLNAWPNAPASLCWRRHMQHIVVIAPSPPMHHTYVHAWPPRFNNQQPLHWDSPDCSASLAPACTRYAR